MVGLCEIGIGAIKYSENFMFSPVLNLVSSLLCMAQPDLKLVLSNFYQYFVLNSPYRSGCPLP